MAAFNPKNFTADFKLALTKELEWLTARGIITPVSSPPLLSRPLNVQRLRGGAPKSSPSGSLLSGGRDFASIAAHLPLEQQSVRESATTFLLGVLISISTYM